MEKQNLRAHRSACLKLVLVLLAIWFFVSFGCGILFREQLDSLASIGISVGNAPLGFWMAQQGSIICFVLLLIAYAFFMNKLDRKFGFDDSQSDSKESNKEEK